MAIIKTNISDVADKNYAEFDLGLLCEEAYRSLKPLDMVLYTLLNNQHGLSVKTTLNGSKRFVDSKGYIFVSIGQEKLCKILRTTIPTLKASLKRLASVDLIQEVNVGNMKCNRIYVGKLNRTITLGEFMKDFNVSADEEITDININADNINDLDMKKAPTEPPIEAYERTVNKTVKKQNNSITNIPQNKGNGNGIKCKKEFKPNYNNVRKNRFNDGTNNTFTNYDADELEKLLMENQKGKFK